MGIVPVGETARQSLFLRNTGEAALAIDSIALAAGEPAFRVVALGSRELAPGERLEVQVEFHPTARGSCEDLLIITSEARRLEFRLTGEGGIPRAIFSPLPEVGLAFGEVDLGQTRSLDLTVINRGEVDLHFSALEITSGAFLTSWEPSSAPPVAPGQRQKIPVVFRPLHEGRASGRLILHSNDPEKAVVEFPLLGSAQQSPPRVEVFCEERLDFGSVAMGKEKEEQLVLRNGGGKPFAVALTLEGEANGDFVLETSSISLPPGEFRKVRLRFRPRELGDRRAELVVGTEAEQRRIELFGVAKFLKLTPTSVDFERVVVGRASSIPVEIFNLGNADFVVTNVISSNPVFALKSPVSPSTRFVLPADSLKSLPVSVTFAPSARGVFNGVLQLQGYWDETFETREILLNGTGIAADLELYPAGPFEFDYVVLGEEAAQTLVATNTGDTDLKVEAYSETSEVRLEPSSFFLPPGQSITLKLVFAPQGLGLRTGTLRLVSNDVREKTLSLQIKGKGGLGNLDLARVVSVLASRKARIDTLKVDWNNAPIVLTDQTKLDVAFAIPEELRQLLVGRKFGVEWVQLDPNYEEQGSPQKIEVEIQDADKEWVLAERFNLRLSETAVKRARLKVSTQNYPGAPVYSVSQIFEAGGWKWEFEAKPLVSFLSIRPGRKYKDAQGNLVAGETERLVGLPGFAFFGYHNAENPSISGMHLTAIGNVLEALSTENSIAVSLGFSLSLYKDRFMFGLGWDVYDHRPKVRRKGTADYLMTFKYWGLF